MSGGGKRWRPQGKSFLPFIGPQHSFSVRLQHHGAHYEHIVYNYFRWKILFIKDESTEEESMKYLAITLLILAFSIYGCGENNNTTEVTNEDFIEITSVEPAEVIEGQETAFIINYEYSLSSQNSATILYGFNDDAEYPNRFTMEEALELTESLSGSDTITVTANPVFYEEPEAYSLYMNISPTERVASWVPLANDTWPIIVNQGTGPTKVSISVKSKFKNKLNTKCNYDECIAASN